MRVLCLNTGDACLVDDDIFQKYCTRSWHRFKPYKTSYARTVKRNGKKNKNFLLHRLIMKAPKGVSVDHIDGNGLNCQRSNLRLCTHAQNLSNQRKQEGTTSKFKGVSWSTSNKGWAARVNGKHVGTFKSEEEAGKAYNQEAIQQFGEFARLNTID